MSQRVLSKALTLYRNSSSLTNVLPINFECAQAVDNRCRDGGIETGWTVSQVPWRIIIRQVATTHDQFRPVLPSPGKDCSRGTGLGPGFRKTEEHELREGVAVDKNAGAAR